MVAVSSRILTIALAVYSYLRVSAPATGNPPGAHAADTAKIAFAIQILVGIIFFLIPFFPEAVHFGSRCLRDYAPEQLERIMPLLRDTTGLMGFVASLFFAINVQLLIRQAHSAAPREYGHTIAALTPWLIAGLLAAEVATVFYYLRRFDAAANSANPIHNNG